VAAPSKPTPRREGAAQALSARHIRARRQVSAQPAPIVASAASVIQVRWPAIQLKPPKLRPPRPRPTKANDIGKTQHAAHARTALAAAAVAAQLKAVSKGFPRGLSW